MSWLFLTLLAPLAGFCLLGLLRSRVSENIAASIGVGSIAVAALTTLYVGYDFIVHPPEGGFYTQVLWTWLSVGNFSPRFALYLDGLSLTMLGVVTGVGFFIHLFASWYMRGEEGYSRFFAYMNLFVFSMLILVLGDSLTFLFFGWEGVGLCSYLLIGFYYKNAANGAAAMKAFVITRIGDVFMAIGLFAIYHTLGTLEIQPILKMAPEQWGEGSFIAAFVALMLLGGAVGKSAQLPLQTWLPDAMAGPTPVSALIHAATMVTAGVYLIARTHTIFELAPDIQQLVGVIGAVTLLLAGFTALVQTDIKRILAYSTMSQIGYMFLALGASAWSAAIFHLMTHAFFKALLFLSAGAVIVACHHEQNIFKMGGLYKKLPLVYACFLVGGGALAALPFLTVGFYSKEEILWGAMSGGHDLFLYTGLFGAFLTSLYTFRLIMIVFHGDEKTHAHAGHGISHWLPLMVLLVLSTFIGAKIAPPLSGVLPALEHANNEEAKHHLALVSSVIAISGVLLSVWLFSGKRMLATTIAQSFMGKWLSKLWYSAWAFDGLYNWVFVRPFLFLVKINRRDWIDAFIGIIPRSMRIGHDLLSYTQNGQIRWYVLSVAAGAVVILTMIVFM